MSTPTAAPGYQLFVGIDIAAATATVAWQSPTAPPSRPFTIDQTPSGIAQLRARLQASGIAPADTLLVLEATGSYWISLATALHAAGYAVSVINPMQAHHFAKALLKRAKSDPIDAQTLTRLAATLQPQPWTPPPAIYHELMQRLHERDSLLELRQMLRNQLHALLASPVVIAAVRTRMEQLIATLSEQLTAVEAEIAPTLAQDDAWAAAAARLQSITGVGLLTTAWLVSSTLNFSVCQTPEQATAYAGLAPMVRDSGSSVHGRAQIGHAGNRRLRTALYLATLSAAQHNPVIRSFYQRLRAAGKPMKVARCAAARKLLHIAWAVVTHDVDFDPAYGQDAASALAASCP